MKIETLKNEIIAGHIQLIRLRRSPDNVNSWFCTVKMDDHSMHILVGNDGKTIISGSLDDLVAELKMLGAKDVGIIL